MKADILKEINARAKSSYAYQVEDNRISEEIYEILYRIYQESLQKYPKPENLLAICFVDIFKFIAGTILRQREINHGIVISHPALKNPLKGWPYTGYEELKDSSLLKTKKFGRTLHHARLSYKHSCLELLSKFLSFFGTKRVRIGMLPEHLDKSMVLAFIKARFQVKFLRFEHDLGHIPNLEDQFLYIKRGFLQAREQVAPNFDVDLYLEIFRKHIFETFKDGQVKRVRNLDWIILSSGTEFLNRLHGARAMASKVPVIITMHGEFFGVLDNLVFGQWEQTFAHSILGYGDHFPAHREAYRNLKKTPSKYITSSSDEIRRIFKGTPILKSFNEKKIYYFPTSLRGNQKRFGFHQEMVDLHYLNWQKDLVTYFGESLVVKAHPKDMFLPVCEDFLGRKMITTSLLNLVDQVDLFVFDYASTAFSYAAATDRPIIYLDLKIQLYGAEVIDYIRRRCVYVDVTTDGIPSLKDLLERVRTEQKDYGFTLNYSLSEKSKGRYDALVESLKQGAS